MFYICAKKGNKLGVMDTNDNALEFYTKDELTKIVNSTDICILGTEEMNKMVHYIWRFCYILSYFNSTESNSILSYMENKISRDFISDKFDRTRRDYAFQIKDFYMKVKTIGFDIKPSDMFSTTDLLVKGLINLYNLRQRSEYDVRSFANVWRLDYNNLTRYYRVSK